MNINNQKRQKYSDPLLKKLTDEQMLLSTEVSELNKELTVIKYILRQKQKNLREINTKLIQKSMRGPFLSVVSSLSSEAQFEKSGHFLAKDILVCFDGGKSDPHKINHQRD
ncbi:hypothetical protein GCM10009133_17440 [Cocleimonas flava]|uniref:Uncharacterized protein n=1 Tax=Cocleimonas flava TaxID=634765 RepID=A0A4R1EVE4_9GAMM|nr:hypothetical protein [Cocleimonas flava]TCJ84670.1 hypothetical protein EV695_2629 [Cocleimonas flava]